MSLNEKILQLANNYLPDNSHFVVDVIISKGAKKKIAIYVDSDEGVKIETCSKISRQIAAQLETEDTIEGAYVLEVSSPGLDQPLKLGRQYQKNIGRQIKVLTQESDELKGKLVAYTDTSVKIEQKKGKEISEKEILLEDIKQTKLIITI